MSSKEALPFSFNFETLGVTPLTMLAPWLKAQAGMVSALQGMSEHWYERRSADFAALQDVATCLGGCTTPEKFLAAQSKCASALTERFMADLTGLREDMMSLGDSATAALSSLGPNGAPGKSAPKSTPKAAAE